MARGKGIPPLKLCRELDLLLPPRSSDQYVFRVRWKCTKTRAEQAVPKVLCLNLNPFMYLEESIASPSPFRTLIETTSPARPRLVQTSLHELAALL